MSGKLEGKVAFITGAARGQGRSHALALAREGADIIAIDAATQIPTVAYPLGTEEDLAETVRQVEALDRRIVARVADVRDASALAQVVSEGVAELGRLDIVSANAGIFTVAPSEQITEDEWRDVIDINLTGVWNTVRAALPHIRAGGRGGSIVLTASISGLKADPNFSHYIASKFGVVGYTKALALELAPEMIRVNAVCPTNVNTPMIRNEPTYRLFAPDVAEGEWTDEVMFPRFGAVHAMSIPWIEVEDVSNAVLWLASDESRYVTGISLPIDAGRTVR